MRRNYTFKFSWNVIIAIAVFMNFAFTAAITHDHTDTTYLLKSKPAKSSYKNALHLVLPR